MSTDMPTNPAEIRAEIARTRSDLADTIEALAAKLDVKAQIGSRVTTAKDRMRLQAARAGDAVSESAERFRDRVSGRLAADRRPSVVSGAIPPGEPGWESATAPTWARRPAMQRRQQEARTQAVAMAGIAGLTLLAIAMWLVHRRQAQLDP